MHLRVDYHFHPNFPFWVPLIGSWWSAHRARRIWQEFARHRLDAVIVSEHAFKQPKRTFEFLQRFRPANATTVIIPGVEILTREGADFIVFGAQAEPLYEQEDLLEPFGLSLEEFLIRMELHPELRAIVVNPYSIAGSSSVAVYGRRRTEDIVRRLGLIEAHNCCFGVIMSLLERLRMHRWIPTLYKKMQLTHSVPHSLKRHATICTGGSDAHHPWMLGDCMVIPVTKRPHDLHTLMLLLTRKSGRLIERTGKPLWSLIRDRITIFHEDLLILRWRMTRWWKGIEHSLGAARRRVELTIVHAKHDCRRVITQAKHMRPPSLGMPKAS